ncbi:ERCC4-related helicase [Rhizobium leguminosarum]|uniref:ERCC4-related helicase n=1 Tax=Rhizobium leguminosarum TaxID=384 RepID=A0AAE2SXA2_RHILE|nr:ERCC4-related helicase [Rhizobium leguminosarum]MBB4307771.1 ERCC4-related helicase [Rhizobium leguminosarum]MBB4528930.1 ERCC4-related helicase [Rhizobium leguminosarum]MBB4539958.1 ERCC4-related helicase [Rhizobium leguminosarum]MBB5651649.1 ERCC4-related helicase [Rhizobium leguminosarum]
MQRLPRCKKGGYRHSACGRYRHIRHDRAKAQRKDRQGRNGAGGAVILLSRRLHATEEENRDAKEYKDSCRQNWPCHRLQETAEAAEEA